MDVYNPVYLGLYYFDTFTFTTLGTSGSRGPDVSKTYANAPWRDGDFYIQDGQQYWTVPATGTYSITAAGAYGTTPGRVVSGQVFLNEGQTLRLLVGQCPSQLTTKVQDNVTVGGGGGTFVVSGDTPLIVASGGDGGSTSLVYTIEDTLTFGSQIASTLSSDGTTTAVVSGSSIYMYRNYTLYSTISCTAAASNNGYYKSIDLSSDGNTLSVCDSVGGLFVYTYINGSWTSSQVGTLSGACGTSISSDGTVVMFMSSLGDVYAYVYTGVSWVSTHINDLYSGNANSMSLSGDGNTCLICTFSFGSYSNAYSVSRTGTSWALQAVLQRDYSPFGGGPMCSLNSNGTVAAVLDTYSSGTVYIYNYSSIYSAWGETFVTTTSNFYGRGLEISSDGNMVAFMSNSSFGISYPIYLYTSSSGSWSRAYTIPNTTGDYYFGSYISLNSRKNKIVVGSYYNVYTITYPLPREGSFSPYGSGSGYSGAGYLTDGQCTDPYFGFLTPKAYVNGGFGNTYEYGSVRQQGGFGGGQSPLGNVTALTSITGWSNIYPYLIGSTVCTSLNGTVALVGGSNVKVYIYSSGWDSGTTLYNSDVNPYYSSKVIALSGDGNTALVCGSPSAYVYNYSGGSWSSGTALLSVSSVSSASLNYDGTVALVCTNGIARVFKYTGGSWNSGTNLPWTVQPQTIRASSLSSDGNTAAYTDDDLHTLSIFRYSTGTWYLSSNVSQGSLYGSSISISSDGNVILFGKGEIFNASSVDVLKYSGGSWVTQTITNTSVLNFGQSVAVSPDGTYYFIASSTKIFVYKNDALYNTINTTSLGDVASSSSVFAYSISKQPGVSSQVIFGDVNQLTTTCTATTSIAHGYPHSYRVKITGTNSFNGTWDITTTSSKTFTFEASGGPDETSGYVSGIVIGVSGSGGYTGSAGDGVSGATCYADSTVQNFTDLGPTSNSAGYVTVSLADPTPITRVYDDTIINTEIYASPSGFAYWSDIVYSPELKLFVAPSNFYNGQGIAYSPDGKQWFRSDYVGAGPWAVAWSPELGIFTTAAGYRNYISSNGKNWLQVQGGDWFTDIIWVPFLNKFIAISAALFSTEYFYASSDGQYWSPITTGPTVTNWYYVRTVFASSSDTLIAGVYSSLYLTTDGVNWNMALTTTGDIAAVAYGNGVFFVVTYSSYYYYSTDKGETWSNGTLSLSYPIYVTAVFTNDSIFVTGSQETFVSQNYVTWTRYPNKAMNSSSNGYHNAIYNNEDNYVIAVSDREINLTIDGIIWIPADTTFIGAPYDNVAYSPETSTVVAVASNGQTSTETGIYTKDGVNWNRIPGLFFNPKVCLWNPLQNLFFLDYPFCFDPVSEILTASIYREWIEPTTPPDLLQSYYQQGLNNNFPKGKAFSLSGIIVDTGANLYGGERVSCSGDMFIKMGRYPNGTAYTSTDGINWVSYQLQGEFPSDCARIIYISKYKAFFVLSGEAGRVHKSYDGVEWSIVYQSPGINLSEMLWCPTLNAILIFSIANNLTRLNFSN